jgi:hypothetical protein
MKRFFCFVTVCLLTLGTSGPGSRGDERDTQEGKTPKRVSELMRKKLEHSQKALEGIAVNDFKAISKHADELIDLSKQVEWRVLKTPQYEVHSNEFRRNAENMVKAAKDKNLDAAALSYVELTLTCVRCHKYVREERMVFLEK